MISFFEKHRLVFKFCVSSDVLLNAIGTAGAASSEAKKTLSPLGSSDINSASIDEVKFMPGWIKTYL
jgi:hypothetical protein